MKCCLANPIFNRRVKTGRTRYYILARRLSRRQKTANVKNLNYHAC